MFEWDRAKSDKNKAERGFGFELAEEFDFANALIQEDTREEYGERRFRAFGRIGDRPFMIAFSPRNGKIRIISMRRMHNKEARNYGI